MLSDRMRAWAQPVTEKMSEVERTHSQAVANLVQVNMAQSMSFNTAMANFAASQRLNHLDFNVLLVVVAADAQDTAATPSYLSKQLSLSASTLTSLLERLVKKGLLLRERDSEDRRRVYLHYTTAGGELVAQFFMYITQAYQEVFELTDTQELQATLLILERIRSANSLAMQTINDGIPTPAAH